MKNLSSKQEIELSDVHMHPVYMYKGQNEKNVGLENHLHWILYTVTSLLFGIFVIPTDADENGDHLINKVAGYVQGLKYQNGKMTR